MKPALIKLNITRGEGVSHTLKLWQDAAKTVPVDLTGYTGKSEIRSGLGDTAPLLGTFTVVMRDGAMNYITLKLTSVQSAVLAAGSAGADLFIAPAAADPTVIARIELDLAERFTTWP